MESIWTIVKLIDWGTGYLNNHNIESARLNIELMLSKILNYDRVKLYSNFDQPLSVKELAMLKVMIKRRIASEPLQYILGETYFYGLKFYCRPDVLIPRPETELIIEHFSKITKSKDFTLLDIGTGTGCIAITLAKMYPNASITAIDISEQAIATAALNAELHNVQVELIHADVFEYEFPHMFDYIISNPPYIPLSESKELQAEILLHEPSIAYTDGNDGLTYYRRFNGIIERFMNPTGKFLFEIGAGQSKDLAEILSDKVIDVVFDLSGHDRLIIGANKVLI
ncbi:MAG: peptide chain release factor N(5)-glutamine methyltransferase [Candidatus Kapabacteria bacterium]|nr:peptide chain release factor N(5)-glutamine methyltransferase [Candidatus Kapabacteria bacterium]